MTDGFMCEDSPCPVEEHDGHLSIEFVSRVRCEPDRFIEALDLEIDRMPSDEMFRVRSSPSSADRASHCASPSFTFDPKSDMRADSAVISLLTIE